MFSLHLDLSGRILLLSTTLVVCLAVAGLLRATPAVAADDMPIRSLDEVGKAVVRIETIGEYRDPDDDATYYYVAGTGFIVDPSGLVVTNNHVIAGSHTILVYLEGNERPRYASVVALSECSDLAILKLSGGGYPYLQWHTGPIESGLGVYSFGYSSGTLVRTEGKIRSVVNKHNSLLVSGFETIVHTARVNPGDSGGPLVGADARVLGVNYSHSYSHSGRWRRTFTISANEARDAIRRLQWTRIPESFGLAGEAWQEDDRNGIWISGVHPNSPAAAAGLRAGQVLLSLGNAPMAEDGSMAAYCDTLHQWDGSEPLVYEIFLPDRRTRRSGQFTATWTWTPTTTPEIGFVRQQLDGLEFLLPAGWSDVAVSAVEQRGGFQLKAAPDLRLFEEILGAPPFLMEVNRDLFAGLTVDEVIELLVMNEFLDAWEQDDFCAEWLRSTHTHISRDTTFVGVVNQGRACMGSDIGIHLLFLHARPAGYAIIAVYLSMTEEDELAFDVFRHSFRLIPGQPGEYAPHPTVRILVATLNVRSGPGTNYGRIGGLRQGDQVEIIGRDLGCTWLKVSLPSGVVGWISAGSTYVSFTTSCDAIPVTD